MQPKCAGAPAVSNLAWRYCRKELAETLTGSALSTIPWTRQRLAARAADRLDNSPSDARKCLSEVILAVVA